MPITDWEIRDNQKVPMRSYNVLLTSQEISYLTMHITIGLLKSEHPQESQLYPSATNDRKIVESIMAKFEVMHNDKGFISK